MNCPGGLRLVVTLALRWENGRRLIRIVLLHVGLRAGWRREGTGSTTLW